MRALLYVHALEQLCQFAQLYAQDTNLTSFVEVFTPALSIASADSSLDLKPWKRRLSEVHSSLDRNVQHQATSRTALELQKHRAVPIATHLPRFEENYSIDRAKYGMDPNRDRAETKKISRQYKKEFKGAVRELRKDTRFVAKHQLQKTREKDQLYQSKIRSIVGELSREQGEANVAERQKGKADRKKREQKK
jgi:nucleolar protein 14